MEKTAVCILTRNRSELFDKLIKALTIYPAKDSVLYVVDNASDTAYTKATHRFETPVGIATAKNKCLELCQHHERIFLFEDDIYPTQSGWDELYKDHEHLQYIFRGRDCYPNQVLGDFISYTQGRGCMMYFTKKCIDTIGGFNTDFDPWGFEHLDYSTRAQKAGLITAPFIDNKESKKYFYSADEHKTTKSEITPKQRIKLYNKNKHLYEETKQLEQGTILKHNF